MCLANDPHSIQRQLRYLLWRLGFSGHSSQRGRRRPSNGAGGLQRVVDANARVDP